MESGRKCYMFPLSARALRNGKVLFVFYDFEPTQNKNCTDTSHEHVPNLVWI